MLQIIDGTTWRRSWVEALNELDKEMDKTSPEEMTGMNGVCSDVFDDLNDSQRDKINFVRINEIYHLLRHHTTSVCPAQQNECQKKFKSMEKRTNRFAIIIFLVMGSLMFYMVGTGIMPAEAVLKLFGKVL
jgi:hypothetical protein